MALNLQPDFIGTSKKVEEKIILNSQENNLIKADGKLKKPINNVDFSNSSSSKNDLNLELHSSSTSDCNTSDDEIFISNFFDKYEFKEDEILEVFMGNIYDPSKFWLNFGEVEVFQKYLWTFYETSERYKTYELNLDEIQLGLNCVTFIEQQNLYYRCRIIRHIWQKPNWFKAYLFDFGNVLSVNIGNLYKLDNKFFKVPEFAIRACLAHVCPLQNEMWKQNAIDKLNSMTFDKPLVAQIVKVYNEGKFIEVNLALMASPKKHLKFISTIFVQERLAKYINEQSSEEKPEQQLENFKPKLKCLHHYPSFEQIENCLVPTQFSSISKLSQSVPIDLFYPNQYEYSPKV